MDKEYIQRLKDMLADANKKIDDLANVDDPQQRETMREMFLDSKKEIEALLKKVGASTKSTAKKPAAKKATTKSKKATPKKKAAKKPATKKAKPAAKKKTVKKPAVKKATKKAAPKKTVKKAAPKKAAKKPVVKKSTAKVKPAKKATKKAAPKKTTKKAVKKTTKKAAPKKAAKKPVVKKSTAKAKPAKKPVAKKVKPATKKAKPATKKKAVKKPAVKKATKKAAPKKAAPGIKPVESKPVEQPASVADTKAANATTVSTETPKKAKLSADDKKALKEAKKREKEAKKLAKKQAKEYKKQQKEAKKALKKKSKVDGFEIPQYSDDIAQVRSTKVPEFGSGHPEMTEKQLAMNTEYAAMFYADPDARYDKELKNFKPISVNAYKDSDYLTGVAAYKDLTNTPTAKVGVEAGPLSNGPVAIPNDAADEASPNASAPESTKSVEEAPAKEEKVSKKATKKVAPKKEKVAHVEETKSEPEQPVAETKSTPVEEKQSAVSDTKEDKEALKAAAKREKEAKKLAKKQAKEYKKQQKEAKKALKKSTKVEGYEIPEYSDEITQVRSTKVPEFGSDHPEMTDKQLAMNTEYAAMFYADPDARYDKELKNFKPISVGAYDDSKYMREVKPYKDLTNTPTAKVGVEAGPLSNGPVAIPNDAADEASPNASAAKSTKPVEEAPVKEEKVSKKATKKAAAKKEEAAPVEESKPVEAPVEAAPAPDSKEAKKLAKQKAKEQKRLAKEQEKLAKKQEKEAKERETEMARKQEEDKLRMSKSKSEQIAAAQRVEAEKQKDREAEINKLAEQASSKAAKQQKEDSKKAEEAAKKDAKKSKKQLAEDAKAQAKKDEAQSEEDKRVAEQSSKRAEIKKGEFIKVDLPPIPDEGVKSLKQIAKRQKQLTSKYSKDILEGAIVTTTDYKPDVSKHVIELHDVVKSYITGDIETPVLKGVNLKLNKGDFIVILGPSGSGKTTFLNTISGLDKATKGDVFVLGYNLSYLKDSHLTKFRRKHVGFIFQQYNLLTNLTAKENAEVGENLAANKNKDMTIEDIFETIGMKTQMNKYPHQMSGGQQQRVSIARALAKNPDILFADEPTGALDEEMGRKVLEILVEVNKRYGTTVIVVTHNPNIAKIGNTVIHIRNGVVDEVEKNQKPEDPSTIEWA